MRAKSRFATFLLLAHTAASGVLAQESDQAAEAAEPTLQERLERIESALSNQGLLQMLQQLETLEQEIARLRGAAEEQNHALAQLKKRQRDMYADMDRRLQRFENPAATTLDAGAPPLQTLAPLDGSPDGIFDSAGAPGGEQGAQTPLTLELVNQLPDPARAPDGGSEPGVTATQHPAPALPEGAVALTAPPDQAATPPPADETATGAALDTEAPATTGAELPDTTQPQADGATATTPALPEAAAAAVAPPLSELSPEQIQQEYRQAFNLLKQARYNEAIMALRGFLTRHPDSEFAANAQFWLAEVYYVNSLFGLALAEYSALTQRYPDSPKLTQAKLKAAFCRHELGQAEVAIQQLEDLVREHPGTTAASLAQDRLAAIAEAAVAADTPQADQE